MGFGNTSTGGGHGKNVVRYFLNRGVIKMGREGLHLSDYTEPRERSAGSAEGPVWQTWC